jgi:hypothetical protein
VAAGWLGGVAAVLEPAVLTPELAAALAGPAGPVPW